VREDEDFANVTFGVISGGPIEREVVVELSFSDGTALSELLSCVYTEWIMIGSRADQSMT
jgi:hypothetical protein